MNKKKWNVSVEKKNNIHLPGRRNEPNVFYSVGFIRFTDGVSYFAGYVHPCYYSLSARGNEKSINRPSR